MENPFNTAESTPKRSTLLTVLLVLTFIGSGLNFGGYLYTSLNFESLIDIVNDAANDDAVASLSSLLEHSIEMMEKTGPSYFGILSLLAAVSIIGAVLMWKLNKLGFHLYAISNIIVLLVPMFYGLIKFPDVFGTLVTALFIWLYARELKIFSK